MEAKPLALPSLTALKAFEALGRTGSVRAAGNELNISHTVVSRHIAHLQEVLGVQLVRHEGRGLALTERGRAYHGEVARGFAVLRGAGAFLGTSEARRLDVWSTPGIVSRRLLPRLPELMAAAPRHEVNLQPTLSVPDLHAGEADAVILYSAAEPTDPRLHVEALVRPRVFPVASPAFLDRHPDASTLAGLARAPLLHEESTGQWEDWMRLAGHSPNGPLRGQRLWHAHLAIEAARLGQGVAIANDLLVVEELANGTLVEPVPSRVHMGEYRLVTLKRRAADPGLRALSRWLSRVLLTGALHAPERTGKLMVDQGSAA